MEGYKQTEIGIIPEEWEITSLKDISLIKGRIGWQGLKQTEFTYNSEEPYLITGMNFKDGEIRWDEVYHISFKRYEIAKNIQLRPNDVLMTKDGTIGKLLFVDRIPYPYKASLNSHLLVFRPERQSYLPKFLYYQLDSRYFKNHIELNKSGTTFYGISQETVGKYQMLLPTLQEQQAIAEVLSDTDNLIQSLDKLIAKKHDVKQGAMQMLFNNKEEWQLSKLGDIANIIRGASPRPIESPIWFDNTSSVGWVRISDATKSKKFLFSTTQQLSELGIKSSRFVEKDSLIMSICATIGRPILTRLDVCIHDGFVVFRNPLIDKEFLYYYLTFIEKDWSKNGQTGSQMNLNTTIINNTLIRYPKSLEEQKNVALFLSDIDYEIEKLERQLSKYLSLKQGLMQNLLTGKIRLIKL